MAQAPQRLVESDCSSVDAWLKKQVGSVALSAKEALRNEQKKSNYDHLQNKADELAEIGDKDKVSLNDNEGKRSQYVMSCPIEM